MTSCASDGFIIANASKKSSFSFFFLSFYNFLQIIYPFFMLTLFRISGSYFAISTDFACQMVTFINTFYHFMLPLTPFRYLHILATDFALWSTTSRHFSRKGLTSPEKYAKFSLIKAVTKTRAAGKIPREDAIWCKAAVPLPTAIPLPSRGEEMPRRVRPLKRQ